MSDPTLRFGVTHKPGAIRLDGFSSLVYAPAQHGPGIRTEDRGLPVADVAAKYAELGDFARVATALGTSEQHVRQAVAYAIAAGDAGGA